MYTRTEVNAVVRDAPPAYGGGRQDRSRFPAERVLWDLVDRGTGDGSLRIVARYCVLRAVLLEASGADPVLVAQGLDAARTYLGAAGPDWPEGGALRDLIEPGGRLAGRVLRLLDAAAEAEDAGHGNGARAARDVAFVLAFMASPASGGGGRPEE